jgi:hypothetical protein
MLLDTNLATFKLLNLSVNCQMSISLDLHPIGEQPLSSALHKTNAEYSKWVD